VLPGGTARTSTFDQPHPVYVARGAGCRIVDVDGNERIDFHNNYTALVHGHAHPRLVEAATRAMADGMAFGSATEREVALAEHLVARIPNIEQVRFMCSGTEAVMMAVKAARAATGRTAIAKCEGAFHGGYDYVEVSYDSSPDNWGPRNQPASVALCAGTPPATLTEVVPIPFNDAAAALRLLEPHAQRLAAVLVDAMPNRVGLIPADPAFLRALRDFTRRHGIVLIADDIINFRLAVGGTQQSFGYDADLIVLGKAIGGGFPVGAVGGRRDLMRAFDPSHGKPPVPQAGTFAATPITMATGCACLQMLDANELARIDRLGERVRERLAAAFARNGVDGQVTGRGSLFRIHFRNGPLRDYRDAYPTSADKRRLLALHRFMLDRGFVLTSVALGSVSTVMAEREVDALADAFDAFLSELRADEERVLVSYAE
jgi:glutamate-1-semialdehyde 2,1-aminomutase